MKRIGAILTVLTVFFVIFSCVPNDPAAIYGLNTNNPNNPGSNITGPRILHKVKTNSLLSEEYTSTAGILEKADYFFYDGSTLTDHNLVTVTYSGSHISYFELHSTQTANNNTKTEKITPSYDNAGRIISYTRDHYVGAVHSARILGTITYNSVNMPSGIIEKIYGVDLFNPGTYVWGGNQNNTTITYTGSNVAKAEMDQRVYDTATNTLLNSMISTYEFSQYDAKLSPYSTISKEYRLLFGILHPAVLYQLSLNNSQKLKIIFPMAPVIETTGSFQYDAQNYAISDSGGKEYFYKAIQ